MATRILLILLVVGACTRPCRPGTVLLTVDLVGIAADELDFDVVIGQLAPVSSQRTNLHGMHGTVLVEFPSGYPAGSSIAIHVTARSGGQPVGAGDAVGTLKASCDTMHFEVKAGGADLAVGDLPAATDDLTVSDLSSGAADLADGSSLADQADSSTTDGPPADAASVDLRVVDLQTITPVLTGTRTSSCTGINLTTEGTLDWMHWGVSGTNADRKNVTAVIAESASGTLSSLASGEPCSFSWSDGTPDTSKSNSTSGVYFTSANSFTVTAPAGPTTHTLKVYTALLNATGTLTAHLSDGSHADYVDSVTIGSLAAAVYTITFATPNAGSTLTVTWANTGSGEIGILSTSLQ